MQQDQAPRNRAERRAAGKRSHHKQAPAAAGAALVRPLRPHSSQNAPPEAATGIGAPSAESDETVAASPFLVADSAPADRGPRATSHKAGGSKQTRIWETLVGYYALAGLAVSRIDQSDGEIIMLNAEKCADAWIAAGKGNPQIMHALELITIAGPYTALVTVHVTLLLSIMDRHGVSPFAALFSAPAKPRTAPARSAAPPVTQSAEPAPLPYVPVGANAPTEAPPPLAFSGAEDMLTIPDEGIPAEIDVALRQMARETGRPYQELRQEALVELAQMRMAQNGHARVQTPGALGAPVARE